METLSDSETQAYVTLENRSDYEQGDFPEQHDPEFSVPTDFPE